MVQKLAAAFVLAGVASNLYGATVVDFGQRKVGFGVTGMTAYRTTNELGPVLSVTTDFGKKQDHMEISQPGGWNLSGFGEISFPVKNSDPQPFEFRINVYSAPPGSPTTTPAVRSSFRFLIEGASTTIVRIPLTPPPFAPQLPPSELIGIQRLPYYDNTIYPGNIRVIQPFLLYPVRPYTFQMGNFVASGAPIPPPLVPIPPFPLVDGFGQWRHREWPGKVHAASELPARVASENVELAANPGASDWDAYGGWARGPLLGATGHFRTAKSGGKWYLVDPEGRLFFSMGMNCVYFGSSTPMIDREDWFESLPPLTPAFKECFSEVAPMNYFKDRWSPTVSYNMYALKLRHGTSPGAPFVDLTHRRFRSWGFNTLGTWSAPEFRSGRRTPYTAYVETSGPSIQGSTGGWSAFRDVFHPDFRNNLLKSVVALKGITNDPWCLGIMVDNELNWNEANSLGLVTLASPANQLAKGVFVADLKARYPSIADLNAVWGTTHASWTALLQSTVTPNPARAQGDLVRFGEHFADTYFGTIRSVLRSAAPNKLYLGNRFAAWVNTNAVRFAGIHCDVVSFNIYGASPRWEQTLMGAAGDRPILITEFQFGAPDRGIFNCGQVTVATQAARAAALKRYVTDCLKDPNIVGCHWFQYWDQPVTGRSSDGENGGFGFIDVTGTPYSELVGAGRELGRTMYTVRSGGVVPPLQSPSKSNQTITFPAPPAVTYGTPPIGLAPVSSSGLPVTVELVSGPATVSGNLITVTGAGTVTLRAVQPGSATFNPATPVVQTLAVARAPLTIIANNQRRVRGAANPPLSVTYVGFVNGVVNDDGSATLDVPVQVTTTATIASPLGTYPITPSGAADVNYLISFVPGTLAVVTGIPAFQQSSAADGVLSLEVEHYFQNVGLNGRAWQPAAALGSSGSALAALPNLGVTLERTSVSTSPHLDFLVNFVRAGTHYVWIRGAGPTGSDNSCHIGLDGVVQATTDRISGFTPLVGWSNSTMDLVRASITVPAPGIHKINLWMHEDGFVADKILFTPAAGYLPLGAGPLESALVLVP